jgi:hypothetical protein
VLLGVSMMISPSRHRPCRVWVGVGPAAAVEVRAYDPRMDEEAALRASRTAGLATLVIGSALLGAPRRAGPLAGIDDPRTARRVGLVDLALAPGLLVGTPRWPWLAARAVANVGTAVAVGRGSWSARATAVSLLALTLVDGQAARTLRDLGR